MANVQAFADQPLSLSRAMLGTASASRTDKKLGSRNEIYLTVISSQQALETVVANTE
jgi:hypothetical protein